MIDIVTKSGKKIGKISDSLDDDTLYINGKEVKLSDAYENKELKDSFNKSVKEFKDDGTDTREPAK